jgi:prolyl oligopeptidase
LILLTTYGADRRQIMALDRPAQDRTRWRVLVPEGAATIRAAAVVGAPPRDRLILVRALDNICEVAVHDARSGAMQSTVELPGAGTVLAVDADHDGTGCVLTYTDWVTPPTRCLLNQATGSLRSVGAASRATADVRTEHLRYLSTDGAPVPLTLLTPADASGPRPTLLTVYGGFGVSIRPTYQRRPFGAAHPTPVGHTSRGRSPPVS